MNSVVHSAIAGLNAGWDIKAIIALLSVPISILSLVVATLAFRAVRRQEEAKKDETRPVVNIIKHVPMTYPVGMVFLEVQILNRADTVLELAAIVVKAPRWVRIAPMRAMNTAEARFEMEGLDFSTNVALSGTVNPKGTVASWPRVGGLPEDRTHILLAAKTTRLPSKGETDLSLILHYRQGASRKAFRQGFSRIRQQDWTARQSLADREQSLLQIPT